MRRRLQRYVLEDHATRWKNDSRCMLVAFCWGAFQLLTSATTEDGAIKQGLIVLVLGMAATTLWHGFDRNYVRTPTRAGLSRRILFGYGRDLVFASIALLGSAL